MRLYLLLLFLGLHEGPFRIVSAGTSNAVEITYGSVLKLLHERTKHRLHLHDLPCGSGSGQQSVTGSPDVGDSNSYWVLSLGVSGYEAISLYKGRRIISSNGEDGSNFTVLQLVFYCLIGLLAGMVGGLLGLGGGFILGPVFLELGVPPYSFV